MTQSPTLNSGIIAPDRARKAMLLVAVFYLVGLAGLLMPQTFHFFTRLIPLALLLSAVVLVIFHTGKNHYRTLFFIFLVFLGGFFVEVIGVKTGVIFGEYRYGLSLGPKLFDVPLMIGLNWAMLTYMTTVVTGGFKLPEAVRAVIAALMMVVYDLVLEQVAPVLDMWYWSGDEIPFRNYLSWFLVALAFQLIGKAIRIRFTNKMATALLIIQFLFFLILVIFGTNSSLG